MIAYQRNQILAVVLSAVALAHVSSAAAVADPSAATLRRRKLASGNDNNKNVNNGIHAVRHHENEHQHEHEHSLLGPVRKLFPTEHLAWWNKIQARKDNRAGGSSPTSFSNDGDCFLGMTVMGLPCDEIGADNYVQPTTPSPTTAKPSAAPVTDAPTAGPTASPVSDSPTKSPSASPVTDSPTNKPSASPVTADPTNMPSAAPTTAAPSANPTPAPSTATPTTASPTAGPTAVHSGSPSATPTTASPTAAPTAVHSVSPSAAPTTASPTATPTAVHSVSPSAAPTTASPTASPTAVHSGSPSAAPVTPAPTTSSPTSSAPTSSPIAQDSNVDTDGVTTDSVAIGDDDVVDEASVTEKCVQCTNIPTPYMLNNNLTCATYEYAYERRCGTEFGWWGKNNNTEHCQYSCWLNSIAYASQGGVPCCERDEADDTITGDSSGVATSATTDSIAIGDDDVDDEASVTEKCVQCTNIPTSYMLNNNLTCATYEYAYERRCGTEFGWWGKNNNIEHCQYSCWLNSTAYASQGGAPCCGRDEADDTITGDSSGVETSEPPKGETDGAGINDGKNTDGAGDELPGIETGDATDGADGNTTDGTADGSGSEEASGTETGDATDGAGGNTTDGAADGSGSEEASGADTGDTTDGAEGTDDSTTGGTMDGAADGSESEETTATENGDSGDTTEEAEESSAENSTGTSDGNDGAASDGTNEGTDTNNGKDVDLSDDGSGIADPLDGPATDSSSSLSDEYLPVPLTPFGVEITSEQPINREELSRVTGDFLHAYFKDELPNMGYPHYNNVALSAEEVNRRQRSLRARMLQTSEQEIMISGNVNFEEEPLPDTQLLDNLRSVAFAGEESKAAYLDALKNSNDPGLQSITDIVVYEGDSEFNPSASERIQPGPAAADDNDDKGFKSYVIAGMAALSFVIFGTALFLYNRKQIRDHHNDKDGLMSEFSEEAPDSVLLKGDLGCSDSVDSHDELMKKVPAIDPEPISLIRDAKTLERAMIRSSYNRSVIEKANERVERKSIIMPTDDDDDSKTISFAEIIAKSHSQSPRTKGQWQSIEPVLSPMNNDDEKDISQNELLSPPISADPPTGQSFDEKENERSSAKSIESDDPCLEGCANESPSCKLLDDGTSCGGTSDFTRALVACSPTEQFCGDDDNFSFHEGPATDNSMAMPSSLAPTIELPPPPISMTMDKVSPNHQQIVKALAEGNPSTPFSLVTYTVHRRNSQEQSEAPLPALDVMGSSNEIEVAPSPNGRVGIDSHPNVVVEDYRPSNKPLGIAAHPYATVKSTDPLSP